MAECHGSKGHIHHHRGKSSETFLDKELILKNLNILPGDTVLDAGCGNGYMAKAFAAYVGNTGKVYALDPDDISIETLLSETKDMASIEPFVGDITKETQIAESCLDLIYLSMVFHGFSTAQTTGFLTEVNRLLKPNGRLVIIEIHKKDTPFGPPQNIRLSPDELQQVINLTPLKTVDIGEYVYLQLFQKQQ